MHCYHLNETEMKSFATTMAHYLEPATIIFLKGELGVGKTTFVRAVLNSLGHHDKVKSPTYALVEPYCINGINLFHFDLYRINNAQELYFIGMDEYFSPNSICLIEWPEKAGAFLPIPDIIFSLTFSHDIRELAIETHTDKGKKLLDQTIVNFR